MTRTDKPETPEAEANSSSSKDRLAETARDWQFLTPEELGYSTSTNSDYSSEDEDLEVPTDDDLGSCSSRPTPPQVRRSQKPRLSIPDDPAPDLGRLRASRQSGEITERSVHKLIDLSPNLSTIELTLTAITIAVIVLKVSFSELATQIGSVLSGGAARQFLDVSVSVGFIAILLATLQIPRHFTDALIYSNQDTMRILQMVGAKPEFVAHCFARVVLGTMIKAAWKGLVVIAILYLVISEIMQLWVPVTRTYFLREVAEALACILAFIGVMDFVLRYKVIKFYRSFKR